MTTLGERFVRALAAKDFAGVAAVLHTLVERKAFYSATGDRIGWMRVMCSGFRPAAPG
jgi:hypothetical protein